ncbi:hypothetical protein [Massilia sp. Root418]|uniref:hypothetical protein n=1 Tax=Massilia sp. Root418 TaxID=1736532 RepID=UPI0012F668D6|nr:hypothetical protein [Massilia sp. Root418]
MKKLIFDEITRRCIGSVEGAAEFEGRGVCIPLSRLPADLDLSEPACLFLASDGATVFRDTTALLRQSKAARQARIKAEAARLIEALDWKLGRAREREAAGWGTLAEVDAVLAEREAIRRSSDAAETALEALTDVASVQSFTWAVDVPVAPPRRLTRKQFTERFSSAELQAVLTAIDENGAMRAWWEKFCLADDINLDDPATLAGVQALEIAGLIGNGRAVEVLA